ncbi:hypothetical protein GGP50_000645 [Salinibacter ruber]|uniref:hypothetical protein n=1 Tax=Salinibacter ruber TaxID=146919 RepID=UPI00216A81E4|nr:hypothetical protein [Salinibacter ruber]MCS4192445.1 hypothetical protein [Salinibacter ruber]
MTTPARLIWLVVLCGLGPLLAPPAHGQSAPAAPSPGDTVRTSMPTALWASADAVELTAALPADTSLVVEAVQGERLRVRWASGTGWVSQSALSPVPTVVRRSSAGTGVRPSWRARLPRGRGRALALPRLALYSGRDGAAIVSVLLTNPSRRTIKSVNLGLVRYDRGPDSTAQNTRRRTVRVVGPLAPRELAAYDVRLPNEARRPCVGIRRVRVERLDGTTITKALRRPGRRPERERPVRGALPYAGDDCLAERSPEGAAGSP